MAASQATGAASTQSLGALRAGAAKDPKSAVREAARQFEALFMQELMKSMRATTMSSGMLDNGGTEMATGMLDTQYANQMSGRAGGLAEAIARQLERQMGSAADASANPPATVKPAAPAAADNAAPVQGAATLPTNRNAAAFVQQHSRAAERVAAESGIPANFMLGQAAHETGWGRRELTGSDGRNAHNLFGIKAGGSWTGPVVEATTTEVIGGRAVKVKAQFRAYESHEASFRDYAKLISTSPRYADVMRTGGNAQAFAQGLQKAGYATDPQYAAKLSRVIDTATRLKQVTT
ncbi:MAG: flagellar assembly peptidoglycan hydrolase FlgJ [Burkholderiales bacterium]